MLFGALLNREGGPLWCVFAEEGFDMGSNLLVGGDAKRDDDIFFGFEGEARDSLE